MRYFVICDEESTLTGLRLAGIEGVLCANKHEVDKSIDAAVEDESIALLLVSENCVEMSRKKLYDIKLSAARPLVVEIPGSDGTIKEKDSITSLIREAIGIRL